MAEIEKKLDLTDKRRRETVQELREPSFTEVQYKTQGNSSERRYIGNMSEAAQVSTSSSRDRDSEPDAGIAFSGGRQKLTRRRWRENRRGSGVAPASSESQAHWYRRQDSRAESGPDDGTSNTSELGQRKGSGRGESSRLEETSEQQRYIRDAINNDISAREKLLRNENVYGPSREKVEKDLETFKNEQYSTIYDESKSRRLRSMR